MATSRWLPRLAYVVLAIVVLLVLLSLFGMNVWS
jgi:hypothetical protein